MVYSSWWAITYYIQTLWFIQSRAKVLFIFFQHILLLLYHILHWISRFELVSISTHIEFKGETLALRFPSRKALIILGSEIHHPSCSLRMHVTSCSLQPWEGGEKFTGLLCPHYFSLGEKRTAQEYLYPLLLLSLCWNFASGLGTSAD